MPIVHISPKLSWHSGSEVIAALVYRTARAIIDAKDDAVSQLVAICDFGIEYCRIYNLPIGLAELQERSDEFLRVFADLQKQLVDMDRVCEHEHRQYLDAYLRYRGINPETMSLSTALTVEAIGVMHGDIGYHGYKKALEKPVVYDSDDVLVNVITDEMAKSLSPEKRRIREMLIRQRGEHERS